MTEKTGYLVHRFIEALEIMLLSSGVIYWLTDGFSLPDTATVYIFASSALLFIVLGCRHLYYHFWALQFSVAKYLVINLSIAVILAAINTILLGNNNGVYTAFFGYTEVFEQIFGVSALISAVIFWSIYLLTICLVPIKILFFDKNKVAEDKTTVAKTVN